MIFAFAQYTIFSQLNAPGGPGVSLIQQCIWACRFSRKGYYSLFLAAMYLAVFYTQHLFGVWKIC